MKFEISLNNLQFYAYHGVFEEERKIGNEFKVSLSVALPCKIEIENDELSDTVSYADLYSIIADEMKKPHRLLEKVAFEIVKRINREYPEIESGKISIEKVHPPIQGMLGSASVILFF